MFELIITKITEFVPLQFIKPAFTLLITFIFGSIIQSLLNNYVKPKTHSPALVSTIGKWFKYIIILFGMLSALNAAGINIQGLIAGLGLTGFALGFALKDTLANLIAGIFILLYRPFKINQWIKVSTSKTVYDEGIVKKVDLRYTTLETEEILTLVPNSMLFTNSIVIYKVAPNNQDTLTK